ncbi:long-chain-fatty-acid--CoA ligase [Brackiella oedipodis]|uniref:long-chain-fatty-acid--CoA ligase n=1 Tax=Brackiella oedipodis TaxID=124225 RepID=UPI00056E33B7|nr:long-chain-fatty-acid--CoA ligase [Brackiella oedipodis]
MSKKIWLEHYPSGIPAEISALEHQSLVDMCDASIQKFADRTAFIGSQLPLSYQEFGAESTKFAAYLQSQGITKGDRVAVMLPNLIQYPITVLGIMRCGATVVNCNPLYTSYELHHQLKDSGAKAIILPDVFFETLLKCIDKLPDIKHVIVTSLGDVFGKPSLNPEIVHKAKQASLMVTGGVDVLEQFGSYLQSFPGFITYKEALQKGQEAGFKPVEVTQEDIAFLQYTGGTTGLSKGAILTHFNILSNVKQVEAVINIDLSTIELRCVTAIPLYHIFALTANFFSMVYMGGRNLLIADPRNMDSFIAQIKDYGMTNMTGVNTLYNGLMQHPEFPEVDFSQFLFCIGGGDAIQKSIADRWQEKTGKVITQGYGLTETSPLATVEDINNDHFTGSIGMPVPSTDIVIRNTEGKDLPIHEVGELCIKGPQVMRGYWNRPEETAKVIYEDGFFRSGDLGYMDEQGKFYIVDRQKDMIVVSGFNVYPNEVEGVVVSHPKVSEVAAVGVDHPVSGETIKLYVTAKDPSLTKEEIIAYCRERLTGYKVPKDIEFLDELPKTAVGKILRKTLREKANQGHNPK